MLTVSSAPYSFFFFNKLGLTTKNRCCLNRVEELGLCRIVCNLYVIQIFSDLKCQITVPVCNASPTSYALPPRLFLSFPVAYSLSCLIVQSKIFQFLNFSRSSRKVHLLVGGIDFSEPLFYWKQLLSEHQLKTS